MAFDVHCQAHPTLPGVWLGQARPGKTRGNSLVSRQLCAACVVFVSKLILKAPSKPQPISLHYHTCLSSSCLPPNTSRSRPRLSSRHRRRPSATLRSPPTTYVLRLHGVVKPRDAIADLHRTAHQQGLLPCRCRSGASIDVPMPLLKPCSCA